MPEDVFLSHARLIKVSSDVLLIIAWPEIEIRLLQDDWCARIKGHEELLQSLKRNDILDAIETKSESFIIFLFLSEKHPGVLQAKHVSNKDFIIKAACRVYYAAELA